MKTNYFCLFFFLILLFGCSDDKNTPDFPASTEDIYEGIHNQVCFTKETEDFIYGDLILHIKTPDGSIIQRKAKHNRLSGTSFFNMEKGLKEGKYQFLYLEYIIRSDCSKLEGQIQTFGLGCRIEVNGSGISVTDTYNDQINLWGKGTKEDPYKISTAGDLEKIREAIIDAKEISQEVTIRKNNRHGFLTQKAIRIIRESPIYILVNAISNSPNTLRKR